MPSEKISAEAKAIIDANVSTCTIPELVKLTGEHHRRVRRYVARMKYEPKDKPVKKFNQSYERNGMFKIDKYRPVTI